MATWDEDSPELARNLDAVFRSIRDSAARRDPASASLVQTWHAQMMANLDADDPEWIGRFRGGPGVEGVNVHVLDCWGSPWRRVVADVNRFLESVQRALDRLDATIPSGEVPRTADELDAVITLAALAHARWVAIHPFAEGNGRSSRMWANWILVRYGVPAFVRLRPRPEMLEYASAGRAALCHGEYEPTVAVFRAMYDRYVVGPRLRK